MHGDRRRHKRWLYVAALAGLVFVGSAAAQDDAPPTLNTGAVELGVAATLATIEGITSGTVVVRGALFTKLFSGLGGIEVGASYRHISSLDENGLEGMLSWQRRLGRSSSYPFLSVAGGWRREEIGSFSQSRYPVGFGVGVRSLFGQRSALRAEYQWRRVLGDAVADFSESQFIVGLSIFFRNSSGR